jgi:uncharacterized membrane protein
MMQYFCCFTNVLHDIVPKYQAILMYLAFIAGMIILVLLPWQNQSGYGIAVSKVYPTLH